MNSCFNCLDFGNPRCTSRKDCEKWKPDYQTLEAENTELKRRISELERISNDFFNCSMASVVENTKLKQELETHKRALYLTTRARFFERMEHPYEDDIQAEIDWFLGMAKRGLAK